MGKEFGMLAHHWNGSLDQVQGWYASRKYNGWSALWDGGITRGMLAMEVPWYHKGGDKRQVVSTGLWSLGRDNKPKVIQAPKYFTKLLPLGVPVHGELWYKDRIDTIKRVCGTKYGYSPMWYNIKFMAFGIKPYALWDGIMDIPRYQNSVELIPLDVMEYTHIGETYAKTMGYLISFQNDTFRPVQTWVITDNDSLKNMQLTAIEDKWEGLMFANPKGRYECKRSWNNLKWKGVYEAEAAVYGYEDGKTGKNIGKVGAIKATLVWDDKVKSAHGGRPSMVGKEANFCIGGLTDAERDWERCKQIYPVGSKIKFKYSGVSIYGVPQSCNIYRGM
ncbi:MAG TPA: hypothetical protein EYP60_04385 [bacterium (Candidatus Stahlbacteria)]|nr:hypothetical protein [Candidatus Stahlbacteria bacterium]